MRRGEHLPDNQAEIVFSDKFAHQLEDLTTTNRTDVLSRVVRLCDDPAGEHPLAKRLSGWNTVRVLSGDHRVVYHATAHQGTGTGLIEVLCIGPRSDSKVYDTAIALLDAGLLQPDELTDLWDALGFLDVIAEHIGLDGWDYAPPPAPQWLQQAAVNAGVVDKDTAALMSKSEIDSLFEAQQDNPLADSDQLLADVMSQLRRKVEVDRTTARQTVRSRLGQRCDAPMPRAGKRCIRRNGHPGPHRAR